MFPAQLLPDQNLDPNSPELFKENIKFVQTHLRHVQSLARDVLDGIERAYEGQTNPTQTAASIAALKQSLHNLSDVLRTTGVGALPLISINIVHPSQEEQLVEQTTNAIKGLFNRNTRNQESAAVVASLLVTPESSLRR
ncbi:hypothetical protein HETIRDRAFT_330950 [Heterobasidion irregulare TC 32-1]|uniref:Uncharacterized protein n=1 Tax=Heterobasidion irregulare (strain TC 32-1) TaxID=747525 RepID=W4JR19_HETIT|nr:uncharacterized protein HETIRDRAFT_330950 [Heterobasidion irregulare TC 32-1]ETW75535.1 hypothetical protein HETIRDRAFT_330950 [Heterobasidion irregulare TC 32-1]